MEQKYNPMIEVINKKAKSLSALYHGLASKAGISQSEFWVWYALLYMGGEYTQQSICDLWSFPRQTVNSVISNMAKKGYVYLEPIPGTRNRKLIKLTEAGKEFGESIIERIYVAEQNAIERLSIQEQQECIRILDKYINFLMEELKADGKPL
ncbi:MarR family winged helix-turn-helix transcriptional regulator [Clostridium culturomicium]|uniref:MarR family winged helix-turn-helix transcriptional regulator n=1 Tax=Clostridium culturomicium TaxID=1499683 RepID=UPI003857C160